MPTCKDCPISLVCIATDLAVSHRRYEFCRECGKYWASYYSSDAIWKVYETPANLACAKHDVITCECCVYNGTKKKYPSPDSIQFAAMKLTAQLPLDVIEEQTRILRSTFSNPLETPITNYKVRVTPALQLSLRFESILHVDKEIAGFKETIIKAMGVPRKYLDGDRRKKP